MNKVIGLILFILPQDVKTVEDVLTMCDNLQIYVSTYGLNGESVKGKDFTCFRNDTAMESPVRWKNEGYKVLGKWKSFINLDGMR